MTVLTMPSVQAQNNFWTLLDKAQRQMVRITRRWRESVYVMSPEVLEDYLDGYLAMEAEKGGFASEEETQEFLKSLADA